MSIFNKKKIIVNISGMSCSHCASRVSNTLMEIDGVKSIKVDLGKGKAIVSLNHDIDYELIRSKINELDYEFLGIDEV